MGSGGSKSQFIVALEKMQKEDSIPENDPFWENFWKLSISEDIFQITADQIRSFKNQAPFNLSVLLNQGIKKLDLCFADNDEEPIDEVAKVIIGKEQFNQAIAVLKIISRIMPLVFENTEDQFLQKVFWNNEVPNPPVIIEDGEEILENKKDKKSIEKDDELDEIVVDASQEPLAIRLLNCLIKLCFVPEFTISTVGKTADEHEFLLDPNFIWCAGIGISSSLPSKPYHWNNRFEVLTCLLSCLSENLYNSNPEHETPWLNWMCKSFPQYYSVGFFHSLLNCVLQYDPVGWGVPYNHLVSFAHDYHELCVEKSLHILLILSSYQNKENIQQNEESIKNKESEEGQEKEGEEEEVQELQKPKGNNIFSDCLKNIEKIEDFEMLFTIFEKYLNNPITANNTYLPFSTKSIECHQSVLMLFWKLLQENKAFSIWISSYSEVGSIIYPIVHFIHEGRKDATQLGLVNLGSFVLSTLSANREFAVSLNKGFLEKVTMDLPLFTGNYADLVFLVIAKLITDGHKSLENIYECLLTTMANISPYIKSLSYVTSMKIVKLLEYLIRPSFLFGGEKNYRYCFFVLQTYNNILQYQYEGNPRILYGIVSSSKTFTSLANLQIPEKILKQIEESEDQNRFKPTEEWLNSWKPQLPIQLIIQVLEAYIPKIQKIVDGSANDDEKIINFLRSTTLVGLLPVPHPILIRAYQYNQQSYIWFKIFLWGRIFLESDVRIS